MNIKGKLVLDLKTTRRNHRAGQFLIASSTGIVAIASYTNDWFGNNGVKNPFLVEVLAAVHESAALIYISGLCFIVAGSILIRSGPPIIWESVQSQLDTLQKIAFPNHQNDYQEKHRVTLFRWEKWCFEAPPANQWQFYVIPWCKGRYPWAGWLVPVLRSGTRGKATNAAFFAPMNASPRAEGVAGLAWAKDAVQKAVELPEISVQTGMPNKTKYLEKTATPTWMLDRYLERQQSVPRALVGYPVRTANGVLWGALVIDSQEPGAIDEACCCRFKTDQQTAVLPTEN